MGSSPIVSTNTSCEAWSLNLERSLHRPGKYDSTPRLLLHERVNVVRSNHTDDGVAPGRRMIRHHYDDFTAWCYLHSPAYEGN